MVAVILSLGSNLQPRHHLARALRALEQQFGPLRVSPAYRTPAVGFDGPDFVNDAVLLHTDLEVQALDAWLHALEAAEGRDRSQPRYASRTLDVDIVFYGDRIIDGPGHLRVPRPELKHAFVLRPAAEIAPDFVDPLSGHTLDALWRAHPDHGRAFAVVELESLSD